ncbi:hypothetical protein AMELA_G00227250 [Ameiurus melas]|uniref:Uncharacterized protein n=1 Tax=Ameiurus melas TaxID=219545 RepID=A0A7J6A043_AMEME|nr:hypothetical protein AMELA_G00227250 [Ameiurus melas]
MTSGSETISLHVEDKILSWPFWIIALVTAGLILVVVIYNRRCVHTDQLKEDDSDIYTTVQYNTFTMN